MNHAIVMQFITILDKMFKIQNISCFLIFTHIEIERV